MDCTIHDLESIDLLNALDIVYLLIYMSATLIPHTHTHTHTKRLETEQNVYNALLD